MTLYYTMSIASCNYFMMSGVGSPFVYLLSNCIQRRTFVLYLTRGLNPYGNFYPALNNLIRQIKIYIIILVIAVCSIMHYLCAIIMKVGPYTRL